MNWVQSCDNPGLRDPRQYLGLPVTGPEAQTLIARSHDRRLVSACAIQCGLRDQSVSGSNKNESDDPYVAIDSLALGETLKPSEVGASPLPAQQPSTEASELPRVDDSLYELGVEIARGGMGRIVTARDLRLDRSIAIKELLHPSPSLERRFLREMHITADLQHPGIIAVHEGGRWASGAAFFTMKHVHGRPLDQVIRATNNLSERLALLPKVIAVQKHWPTPTKPE